MTSTALQRVVDAGRALAAAGQQDMVWGHVALRDEGGDGIWIKRSGVGYDELGLDDVQLVGWDGSLRQGRGSVHIECFLHLETLRVRGDVVMSVHSHAPAVNAFSALDEPLRALSHDGVPFALPQIPRAGISGDLVGDPQRGAAVAAALGGAPACLMPRHGFLAVGRTDAEAVMHAVLLESACQLHLDAAAAGTIRSYSDEEELRQKQAHVWPAAQFEAGYAYLLRRAAPPA
ncbi:class II aldolase/adducin family protein [Microbacterium sp.]|uniref:class II aldolase/adducin family protein n=1 Tax=Microbacterium sp. TaxID=51671 RepID=UPI0039E6E134